MQQIQMTWLYVYRSHTWVFVENGTLKKCLKAARQLNAEWRIVRTRNMQNITIAQSKDAPQ